MTAIDGQRPGWNGAGRGRDAPELHMPRTRNVPFGPLARLTNIQRRAFRLLADVAYRNRRHGQPRRPPCVHAALQLAREVFIPNLQALFDEISRVLVRGPHENQWSCSRHEPTEPGSKGRAQRNR